MTEKNRDLIREINGFKGRLNAVILAHNYQLPEIQDIGDFVGDSLELSIKAGKTDREMIFFCGVYFMAETAKILSPQKRVFIPDPAAGCLMADMITPGNVMELRQKYPAASVVCYVNSTAAVKAVSDICCTSSNAVKIVESLDADEVIFIPDMNLGDYVSKQTKKKIRLFEGFCPTHYRLLPEDVKKARSKYPGALFICHPECNPLVTSMADFAGSTARLLKYVRESPEKRFIIGTEREIIYRMKKENPEKEFYLVSDKMVCPNMKRNTLPKLLDVMKSLKNEIILDEKTAAMARAAVVRMLEVT